MVLVAAIVAAIVSNQSGNSSTSQGNGTDAPTGTVASGHSIHAACGAEVYVALREDARNGEKVLLSAIDGSPIYGLVVNGLYDRVSTQVNNGGGDEVFVAESQAACEGAGNPILTQPEVTSLIAVLQANGGPGASSDTSLLESIDQFAPSN